MKRSLFAITLSLFCHTIMAQEEDENALQRTQDILEISLEELGEGSFDFDTYLERLTDLERHPIDLNTAVYDDFQPLLDIGLIDPRQIDNLLKYRERFDYFQSIYELKYVIDWNLESIKKVLPFIYVSEDFESYQPTIKQQVFGGKQEVFLRYSQVLEQKRGYSPLDSGSTATRYPGNPGRLYLRYRYNYRNKISYGFTAEKDPGEAFFKAPQQRGFDYYSGHVFLRDLGPVKALALGDYQANFGQGLTLWTGFGFAKSPYVMNIKRSGRVLKPYTSVNENNFLRGAAATFKLGKFNVTGLFSRNRIDANVQRIDTTNNTPLEISNFQLSGLHRTESEVANKGTLTWTVTGGHAEYQHRASKIGVSAVQHFFNSEVNPGDRVYQRYYLSDKSFGNYSLDYALMLRKFYLFGESSMDNHLGHAHVHGFVAQLDPRVKMAAVFRYFTEDYRSFGNNSFSENTRVQNESGLYWGWELTPHKKLNLQAYVDYFKFPWPRFGVDGPSYGVEYFAQANIDISRYVQLYFRYRYKKRERNNREETGPINTVIPEIRQNWRAHIAYRVFPFLTLKNRVEFVRFKNTGNEIENGFLIYQDFNFSKDDFPLSANLRLAFFDSDTWNTRIYAYENDLLYYFSIPAYSGQGVRFYLNIKIDINKNFDFWLKYAISHFSDRNTVGTGLEEIEGNKRSELRGQIRMKF
ncbi:MAG: hypothetical protein WD048_04140 [Chitinophagales bacterium]